MIVLGTQRLVVRQLGADDAAFILRLVNEPSWLEFIGDKSVHTLADAANYIRTGPVAMYARCGFGLWLVERRDDAAPLGMCGLIKRDSLPDVDVGFAFLPQYWGAGYAFESARAVLDHGMHTLGIARIVAITAPANDRSIRLLERLGMQREATLRLDGHDHDTVLYSVARETPFALRDARLADKPVLEPLIAASVRGLSRGDYTGAQIEAALGTAFGVDSELIRDGTYFVAEAGDAAHTIVACGGWSRRRTLFGGDAQAGRQSELLDPARDAARVRAFFVRPEWARRGIGRALLERCERAARAEGFTAVELLATLPGHRLYRALGYVGDARVVHTLAGGVDIEFIPMRKVLAPGDPTSAQGAA